MTATIPRLTHFVNGERREHEKRRVLEVWNPGRGEVIAHMPVGTAADVDEAIERARAAGRTWSRSAPGDRERILYRLADAIETNADRLAQLETLNTGKPIRNAREVDVLGSAAIFRFYAGYPTKQFGHQIPTAEPGLLCYTRMEPIGVVGAIVPWNYPLLIATYKVAAALAAGCSIVVKPSPETPLTALELADLASKAGVPPGVLNVVLGDAETGAALAGNPGIAKLGFTGSTQTGRAVLQALAQNVRPAVMELGGKSPSIVFDDVDVSAIADAVLEGAFDNAGQECSAGARILVHENIFESFVGIAADRVRAVRVGNGLDSTVTIGPLISERHRNRVAGYVERALAEGARVVAQGAAPPEGFFYPPTLLTDVDQRMEICREEVFGPVATVQPFATDDDALAMANSTGYGLAAGIWTSDIGRSLRFAEELEAGTVWVNSYLRGEIAAPFGGVKNSGFGRELGLLGPLEFCQVKTVYIKDPRAVSTKESVSA